MIKAIGNLSEDDKKTVINTFLKHDLIIEFTSLDLLRDSRVISFDKISTQKLNKMNIRFYNWDLVFSLLGENDSEGDFVKKLEKRILILKSLMALKSKPIGDEIHASIRVHDLAKSAQFYTWLFGVEPKEWTHRYVTFLRPDTNFNFVLLVADEKELHHDTLYHLGIGVSSKEKVIEFYNSALENKFHIEKLPRTTWKGTPLHELWLKDPDGTLIEVYARLSEDELKDIPDDKMPVLF